MLSIRNVEAQTDYINMRTLRLLAVILTIMTASVCNAQTGYKGMIEGGRLFNTDLNELNATEFSTAHGYQFTPYLFYKHLSVYSKVGYTYQKVDSPIYANSNDELSNIGGISVKIGFEF